MDKVEEADFVLAHGTEALGLPSGDALPMELEDLEKILENCAAKNIPMVVANPDFVTVEARALRVMPGNHMGKVDYLILFGLSIPVRNEKYTGQGGWLNNSPL